MRTVTTTNGRHASHAALVTRWMDAAAGESECGRCGATLPRGRTGCASLAEPRMSPHASNVPELAGVVFCRRCTKRLRQWLDGGATAFGDGRET